MEWLQEDPGDLLDSLCSKLLPCTLAQSLVRLHIFLGFLGILTLPLLTFASSDLRLSLSLVSSPHLCRLGSLHLLWLLTWLLQCQSGQRPLWFLQGNWKAHFIEAKHVLEYFCLVAKKVKAQSYSKKPWLVAFYLDGRILQFVQCYIWSGQSATLSLKFNMHFKNWYYFKD